MAESKGNRDETIGIRLTESEKKKLEGYANECFIGIGSAMRQLALTKLKELEAKKRRKNA